MIEIPIACPHCGTKGPKTRFDKETLSLFCQKCEKVIFPTTQKEEDSIPKNATTRMPGIKYVDDDDRDFYY